MTYFHMQFGCQPSPLLHGFCWASDPTAEDSTTFFKMQTLRRMFSKKVVYKFYRQKTTVISIHEYTLYTIQLRMGSNFRCGLNCNTKIKAVTLSIGVYRHEIGMKFVLMPDYRIAIVNKRCKSRGKRGIYLIIDPLYFSPIFPKVLKSQICK